jgi:hypothetical protein
MPFTGPEIEPAPPFQPVQTRQGTVTSLAQAENLHISTAARIQLSRRQNTRPATADIKDRQLLAAVLGQTCGLTRQEMLRQVAMQVTAKVQRDLAVRAAPGPARARSLSGAPSPAELAGRDFPEHRSGPLNAADSRPDGRSPHLPSGLNQRRGRQHP